MLRSKGSPTHFQCQWYVPGTVSTACGSYGYFERRAGGLLAAGAMCRASKIAEEVTHQSVREEEIEKLHAISIGSQVISRMECPSVTHPLHDRIQHDAYSCARVADVHVVIRIEAILYYGREDGVDEGARILQDDNCLEMDDMVSETEVEVIDARAAAVVVGTGRQCIATKVGAFRGSCTYAIVCMEVETMT